MMDAHGDFIGGVGPMVEPIASIVEKVSNGGGELVDQESQIAFGVAKRSGPSPRVVEHLSMEAAQIVLRQRIVPLELARRERPPLGCQNVLTLPLVQLGARGQCWDESTALFFREGSVALDVVEEVAV